MLNERLEGVSDSSASLVKKYSGDILGKLKNIENISDYSIALMKEILGDVKKLSELSGIQARNQLDSLNKKIDFARGHGVNVDFIDRQVLEFRLIIFKRDINNKIEEISHTFNTFSFDINRIQTEYAELKKEKDIDYSILEEQMHILSNELLRAKVKFMVKDVSESGGTSSYTIDHIAHELEKLKQEGINVDDIEEMLFG